MLAAGRIVGVRRTHLRCHAPGRGRVAGALSWSSRTYVRPRTERPGGNSRRRGFPESATTSRASVPRRAPGHARGAAPHGAGRAPSAADFAAGHARHRLARDPHCAQVVEQRRAERRRRAQPGHLVERFERHLAADERARRAERGRRRGSPAAPLDQLVVERVGVPVGRLLAGVAPGRPGTYSGPTRATGGEWLIVMNGTPAATQAALTQRSMSWAGQSAAFTTKSAPSIATPTDSTLSSRRGNAVSRQLESNSASASAAASVLGRRCRARGRGSDG